MSQAHWLLFPTSRRPVALFPCTTFVAYGCCFGKLRSVISGRIHIKGGDWTTADKAKVLQRGRKWYVIIQKGRADEIDQVEITWLDDRHNRVSRAVNVTVGIAAGLGVDIVYPPAPTAPATHYEIAAENFAAWGTNDPAEADIEESLTFTHDTPSLVRDGATWILTYGDLDADPDETGTLQVTARSGGASASMSRALKIIGVADGGDGLFG